MQLHVSRTSIVVRFPILAAQTTKKTQVPQNGLSDRDKAWLVVHYPRADHAGKEWTLDRSLEKLSVSPTSRESMLKDKVIHEVRQRYYQWLVDRILNVPEPAPPPAPNPQPIPPPQPVVDPDPTPRPQPPPLDPTDLVPDWFKKTCADLLNARKEKGAPRPDHHYAVMSRSDLLWPNGEVGGHSDFRSQTLADLQLSRNLPSAMFLGRTKVR